MSEPPERCKVCGEVRHGDGADSEVNWSARFGAWFCLACYERLTAKRMSELLGQHRALIEASAIAPEVAAERGYYSETIKARVRELGFANSQCLVPALVIPIGNDGRESYQIRPDNPRNNGKGHPVKYETPYKARNVLDAPHRVRPMLADPSIPLWITEGVRKADAAVSVELCCVALTGVWNWLGTNDRGGSVALPDWRDIALNGRLVHLAFDSDARHNPDVQAALLALADYLGSRGAEVRLVLPPTGAGGVKAGLDDYLAAGHSVDDLLALATDKIPAVEAKPIAPRWDGPAPETADVLSKIREYIRRYVIVSDDQALAVTLWVAHTHAFAAAGSTPYLAINSAEPESGKTQLLEVLETLVANPWLTGRVTAAVLPRKIDAVSPTLLLDESDTAFSGAPEYSDALRGILNTGYRASGYTTLCVGQGAALTFQDFRTFCPKAIAGLGKLPDTVRSRAISIRLKRRRDDEGISEWLPSTPPKDAEKLRGKLTAWGHANAERLRKTTPERPEGLGDRAFDVWRPLLAIAGLAAADTEDRDEDWLTRAREVAERLSGKARADAPTSDAVRALAKLRSLFADSERLSSANVVAGLNADDSLPFGGWRNGEGITMRRLAAMLRSFDVAPRQIWLADRNVQGYRSEDFADAFARYLAPVPGSPNPRSPRTQAQSQESAPPDPLGDAGSRGSSTSENDAGMGVLGDLGDSGEGERQHPRDDDCRGPADHYLRQWRLPGSERWICAVCQDTAPNGRRIEWRIEVEGEQET